MIARSVFDGQRGLIASVIAASFFVNLLVLTVPLYMLQLFSRVLTSGSIATLVTLSIGAGIALMFYFLFDALRQKLVSRLGVRLEADLGPTVLETLVASVSATDRRGMQPMRDLQELRRFVTGPPFLSVLDAPWSIPFVAIIFLFHPMLGWIAVGGILALFSISVLSEFTGRKPNEASIEATQQANSLIEEMLRNADVVRASAGTGAVIERWKSLSNESLHRGVVAIDRIAVYSALARFVRFGLQILILSVGVTLVLNGQITPGVMIATSILLSRAVAPVEQSISSWRAFLSARLAVKRLNTLLKAVERGEERIPLPEPAGRLAVENATVVLPDRQDPVLFNVSFDLRPGEALGVIGPSGSGKTTLARCLTGLHPLSRGTIRIDDAALDDWPDDQIGSYVGYLPQRVELFNGTVAENIATMDENASPAAIVKAAKDARVHDLILSFPGGYNAQVGNRGELLSAGQRQRLGLARALYGEKRLIVLDEPNANLDPDGEMALAEAVRIACSNGAAVIVVTHRLPILKVVDYAMLLQAGRVAKFGRAKDILESKLRPMSEPVSADGDKPATTTPIREVAG